MADAGGAARGGYFSRNGPAEVLRDRLGEVGKYGAGACPDHGFARHAGQKLAAIELGEFVLLDQYGRCALICGIFKSDYCLLTKSVKQEKVSSCEGLLSIPSELFEIKQEYDRSRQRN